jgi:ABC-type methionine transport system ATPase subunit
MLLYFWEFSTRLRTSGGSMATKRVKLTFPQELIKEPVIFTMARKFNVMPNIRSAKVTESVGEVVLELEGEESELEVGIAYLKERGVKVDAVESDPADL